MLVQSSSINAKGYAIVFAFYALLIEENDFCAAHCLNRIQRGTLSQVDSADFHKGPSCRRNGSRIFPLMSEVISVHNQQRRHFFQESFHFELMQIGVQALGPIEAKKVKMLK
ncbi:hypothetical protein FGO68_gene8084 [Halteria grandinella]|uniref:Uncharacterized protein n=1 Tax=Halteria grandinella TaxID=5974 RepID=A0A8J8N967_HALGN|nr:hypothetical protein FGO68_gene8084 [Halteria grandinella]